MKEPIFFRIWFICSLILFGATMFYCAHQQKEPLTTQIIQIKIDSNLIDSIRSLTDQIIKNDSIINTYQKPIPYEKINYAIYPDSQLVRLFQSEVHNNQ